MSQAKPTEADIRKLFKQWIERLQLEHWQIQVVIGSDVDESADAEVDTPMDYMTATVRLGHGWTEWSWDQLEETIVHELMHLHLQKLQVAAFEANQVFGAEARNLYIRRFTHELEKSVDSLTMLVLEVWRSD